MFLEWLSGLFLHASGGEHGEHRQANVHIRGSAHTQMVWNTKCDEKHRPITVYGRPPLVWNARVDSLDLDLVIGKWISISQLVSELDHVIAWALRPRRAPLPFRALGV